MSRIYIEEMLALAIILPVSISITLACIIIRPVWFIFDRRRYRIPNELWGEPLGLWRFFCLIHYALKEDVKCPNCGRFKQELIKG